MTCPECQRRTRVLETRESPHGTRRRRQCRSCGHRFTTFEAVVTRVLEQRGHVEVDAPDVDEIAHQVSEAVRDDLGALLEALPGETVEALLEEAERRQELTNGYRPELLAGDDEEAPPS
jgi:hypothetical protein